MIGYIFNGGAIALAATIYLMLTGVVGVLGGLFCYALIGTFTVLALAFSSPDNEDSSL